VQFCHQCDEWLIDKTAWNLHCQRHLDTPESLPLQCDPLVFRYASACAGYCPFCLGDSRLTATQRMYQFLIRNRWQEHISEHVQELLDSDKAAKCPHPICTISFDSVQDLLHHLQDVHCVMFTKAMKRCRSGLKSEEEAAPKKRICSSSCLKSEAPEPSPGMEGQLRVLKNLAYKRTLKKSIEDIDESTTSVSPGPSFTGSDTDSEGLLTECETPGSLVCSDDLQETAKSDWAAAKDKWMNRQSMTTSTIKISVTDQDLIPQGKKFAVIIPQYTEISSTLSTSVIRRTGMPRGRPKGTTKGRQVRPPSGKPRG
jgi:hypothetical protein